MNLKEQTIRAFLWLFSTRFIGQGFSWIVIILLARLLLPADFGLIAMATLFIGFLNLFNELGIGAAIIQKQDLEDDDLHSTFWLSILFGLILYMLTFILAPWIGSFFNSEKLPNILRVLGINFVIGAFKIVPYNTLTKELAFNKRSKAELSSTVMGGILSLALAILGYGVWSLVYGSLLHNLVLVVLVMYFCKWWPKPIFLFRKVYKILKFGITVMGSRVLWYFYRNSDYLIIGKFLGDMWLGFYSIAFRLSNFPIKQINTTVNSVNFPVFSKLQSEREKTKLFFLKITQFASLITFPYMAGLFLVSESLIGVVLTEKWLPMLVPLKVLCIIGVLRSLGPLIPPLLVARGKPHIVLKYNVIGFIVLPVSFLVGINYGVNGVALAWLVAYPCVLAYLYRHGLNELDLSFFAYLENLFPSITSSIFMVSTVLFFQLGDGFFYNENQYVELVGSFVIGAIAYLAYLFLFYRDIVSNIIGIFNSLGKKKLKEELVLQ